MQFCPPYITNECGLQNDKKQTRWTGDGRPCEIPVGGFDSPSIFPLKNLTNCGLPNDNLGWQSIGVPNNGLSKAPFRNVSPSPPAAHGLGMKRQNDVLIYPFSLGLVRARLGLCVRLWAWEKEGEIAYWMIEIISYCSLEIVGNADLGYVEYSSRLLFLAIPSGHFSLHCSL